MKNTKKDGMKTVGIHGFHSLVLRVLPHEKRRLSSVRFCFPLCIFNFAVPPEVTVSPKSLQVLEGASATLFCNATGEPAPSLEWRKDDDPTVISTSANFTLANVSRHGNQNNSIRYHCTATNGYGVPMVRGDTSTVTIICE